MINRILFLFILAGAIACVGQNRITDKSVSPSSALHTKITILQLNIWQEGTMVPRGFEAIVQEIERSGADIVMLSEVRNYEDVDFTEKLIQALRQRGLVYYSFRSEDSGILSKFPVVKHETIYALTDGDHGSMYKLVTMVGDQRIAAYTAHLDYQNYASYLPRGYDGKSWKKLPQPVTDNAKIKEMNTASKRVEAVQKFIEDAKQEINRGSFVFFGGDFNEPSHLDWMEDTKDLYDHNGVVYKWDVSALLYQNGFVDAYRRLFPSAVTHPGFTYPSDNKDAKVNQLTWAPRADERERIDFIYYYPNKNLRLESVQIVGPDSSIVRGRREKETSSDPFLLPIGTWPTDHKGVLAVFYLR